MSYEYTCERRRDEEQMLSWSILIGRSEEIGEEVLDEIEEDDYTEVTEYITLE